MPFSCVHMAKGNGAVYRDAVEYLVYEGIVEFLKAPEEDRTIVIGEHDLEDSICNLQFDIYSDLD